MVIDFNNVILDFVEGHQWFDCSSEFANYVLVGAY